MKDREKVLMYNRMLSHYRMLQADAQKEHERYIIMAAALDPEDEDERHHYSFMADKAFSDVLLYERIMAHIEDLQQAAEYERYITCDINALREVQERVERR